MRCHWPFLGEIRANKLKDDKFIKSWFFTGKADLTKENSFGFTILLLQLLPTSIARRYLVPTALGASGRRISAVAVVVVISAGAVEGAAAAAGFGEP